MKIVFMGTPEYAKTILQALFEAGHEIVAVYTQPDRPKGRSGQPVFSEVKEYALSKNLPVFQPEKIKASEEVERLKSFGAEVFVVAAFGQIVSQEILDIPPYGCLNAHGSILPKYRGASPIQRAIAYGETETGVTVMRMDKGIDTGDIIDIVKVPISDEDDEDSVYVKLAQAGAKLMCDILLKLKEGKVTYTPQNNDEATYARMLKKEDGLLCFQKTARELDCMVRGYLRWPTAYMFFNKKMIKVYKAKCVRTSSDIFPKDLNPGTFFVTKKNIYLSTKEGFLELLEVQPEGKKKMAAMDFARGAHIATGDTAD